jgi:hypothetical protein
MSHQCLTMLLKTEGFDHLPPTYPGNSRFSFYWPEVNQAPPLVIHCCVTNYHTFSTLWQHTIMTSQFLCLSLGVALLYFLFKGLWVCSWMPAGAEVSSEGSRREESTSTLPCCWQESTLCRVLDWRPLFLADCWLEAVSDSYHTTLSIWFLLKAVKEESKQSEIESKTKIAISHNLFPKGAS